MDWRPLPPACAMNVCAIPPMEELLSLVALSGRSLADVDGWEYGEDECLQARDQDHLEKEECDRHDHGERAERRDAEDHHEAAAHEQDQQVARQEVCEEPHRERDDPDEVGDHLD